MDSIANIIDEINNINVKYKKYIALNQKQTAEIIGVSSSTLENWRKQGIGIEYIKTGIGTKGRILYPKQKIAEFLLNTIKTA
ncbi:helix-turn-helix transcriptional regulator [Poseidonibacter ostreae]|uniref:Helix-turn-helix domain-containing protein n=1 Tax=Poseidonibacter ostreae TaxID=2654171 RepID=A0A6L4WTW9_9BACT|nr:helix-turn-helix domain-containing protein [Poseidonibacter ostreae]KAB7888874.1 helix-turn-helix domain-containing protein [Poseidonibacter ostreae]KAB7889635.1 helix-turn-helix domain-containing protein [Poseidonibacter ostreae]